MAEFSRRAFVLSGLAASQLGAQTQAPKKPAVYPSEAKKYADPTTELDVYRLSSPEHSTILPAYYNRAITHNNASMLLACDRGGELHAYRFDLKNGESHQLTEVQDLDPLSLTFTPDSRSFCFFAGRQLFISTLNTKPRPLYQIPDGWERCPGLSIGLDGTHATFAEKQGAGSRIRMVTLVQGIARTVVEMPFEVSHPVPRPNRAQVLFRQGDDALWLVNSDGTQKHVLKTAAGKPGPAAWTVDGKSLLYLSYPTDPKILIQIRDHVPDTNNDTLVAKTSQYGHFCFNAPATVFAGACRSLASPTMLIMLRHTQREVTMCEHKASRTDMINPRFSPDTQRMYFQSDRDGKPAVYSVRLEKWLDKTGEDVDSGGNG